MPERFRGFVWDQGKVMPSAPFVLLDDARPDRERLEVYLAPVGIVCAQRPDQVAAALGALSHASAQGLHAAGYVSYELGYVLEPRLTPLLPEPRSVPLLWFGLFRSREVFEGEAATRWLHSRTTGRGYAGPLRFDETLRSYEPKFAIVHDYILAGDVYQVNLTFPARFGFFGDALSLYTALRPHAQSGCGAYLFDGTRSVLSLSPERFFEREADVIRVSPMKGTAARAADPAEDLRLRSALMTSAKDRAENVMIVDLIRNDLSRVAELGSVEAEKLFAIETYPTVHQMVSTVSARLRRDTTFEDLLKALFPCGSVTGAPKIRAMEIIRELETHPRGIYCGAIGRLSPDGAAAFNVAIRTLTLEDGRGRLDLGSGIVADSNAAAEYAECVLKSDFFAAHRRPIALIETLRRDPGAGLVRDALHLARMAASASALGIGFDAPAARRALNEAGSGAAEPLRLRLHLAEDGAFCASAETLSPSPPFWRFAVSARRVRSSDVLLEHKTDWREFYEEQYAAARATTSCDEVVFLNERDEVTEGSRTNVFAQVGGRLITPPLSCGLLDGCLRRSLLDCGACAESVLRPDDLDRAERVYLGNSLRGLIPAIRVPWPQP
jgi:para-aminobenzoate synthetase / 4-amino-4-deoxychorismate lyase